MNMKLLISIINQIMRRSFNDKDILIDKIKNVNR